MYEDERLSTHLHGFHGLGFASQIRLLYRRNLPFIDKDLVRSLLCGVLGGLSKRHHVDR